MVFRTILDSIEGFERPWVLLFLVVVSVFYILSKLLRQSLYEHIMFPDISGIKATENTFYKKGISAFPRLDDFRRLAHSTRFALFILTHFCLIVAFIAITIALAGPYGRESFEARTEGMDIIFTLDMSNSMKAYDYSLDELEARTEEGLPLTNRFESAVATIKNFVNHSAEHCRIDQLHPKCNRIGLTVFGESAYLDIPLTTDYEMFNKLIDRRSLDDIPSNATAIGDGLARSIASLRHAGPQGRVIILLTDGDKKGGRVSVSQCIKASIDNKVSIYPVLIGDDENSFIRIEENDAFFWQAMKFPTNFELLENIAVQTGGQAYQSRNTQELIDDFDAILNRLENQFVEIEEPGNRIDYSRYFILLTFIFALLGTFFRSTFSRLYP